MTRAFPLAALPLLLLPACGDVVTASAPGRADSGSPPRDAGHDAHDEASALPISNACPTSQPTPGTACAVSSFTDCEYGSDPDFTGDTVLDCVDGGWRSSGLGPDDAGCSTTNSALCPATFGAVTEGSLCAVDAGGLAGVECYYPEARCFCNLSTAPPTWQCGTTKMAGCPEPRPRLGTPCEATDANLMCVYDDCAGQYCELGRWQRGSCGK